ncbi:transmembrane protein, putative (macronuclear) [Tetrahymena thermophila SB210]|uniref:Transmembrane protein, putative n=1 Tax=Tetrahymena thermophila (strain SB210) TaxID=312017 RepID=W7XK65_TETTS|nr:transmembrane protein, putative [Tetrahymena thermophila SB210]EWS74634.1 transmembrane protein, putative [Tetrahymena thermophila SB210]|eukprot:XP_012652856.1 transmembrane protein, putative [Tetrahymena thermophila SB210]
MLQHFHLTQIISKKANQIITNNKVGYKTINLMTKRKQLVYLETTQRLTVFLSALSLILLLTLTKISSHMIFMSDLKIFLFTCALRIPDSWQTPLEEWLYITLHLTIYLAKQKDKHYTFQKKSNLITICILFLQFYTSCPFIQKEHSNFITALNNLPLRTQKILICVNQTLSFLASNSLSIITQNAKTRIQLQITQFLAFLS